MNVWTRNWLSLLHKNLNLSLIEKTVFKDLNSIYPIKDLSTWVETRFFGLSNAKKMN